MALSVSSFSKKDAILKAFVTDLGGNFRELILPISVLPNLCSTGTSCDGSSFGGINKINDADAVIIGDITTLFKCPPVIASSEKEEYWIICNIHSIDGKTHSGCTRSKLISLQKQLASQWDGGELYLGAEPEGYLMISPEEVGDTKGSNNEYFNPQAPIHNIITDIINVLLQAGFKIERGHTEVGQNQFEINWKFDKAEYTCDKVQFYKLICKKVARKHNLYASFLPKPFPNRNGSGMHYHISVINSRKNLFYALEAKGKKFFSDTSLHFIQGIIQEARKIALVSNPIEASYPRLIPGFEAPVVIAVGERNRSACCRIPHIEDPKKLEKLIRVEFRFPDPIANPYLLASCLIIAGLSGMESKNKFIGFTDENLYHLSYEEVIQKGFSFMPRNLWESYQEFSSSRVLKKGLGESLFEGYKTFCLKEIDSCQPYGNTLSMKKHF